MLIRTYFISHVALIEIYIKNVKKLGEQLTEKVLEAIGYDTNHTVDFHLFQIRQRLLSTDYYKDSRKWLNARKVQEIKALGNNATNKDIERILNPKHFSSNLNLQKLLDKAREYQSLPLTKIANDLNCHPSTVSSSIKGQINGRIAYEIKEYLEKNYLFTPAVI